MSQACVLYVMNKFNTHYRCTVYALNAFGHFGAHFRHVCTLHAHTNFTKYWCGLLPNASVTCLKRV